MSIPLTPDHLAYAGKLRLDHRDASLDELLSMIDD